MNSLRKLFCVRHQRRLQQEQSPLILSSLITVNSPVSNSPLSPSPATLKQVRTKKLMIHLPSKFCENLSCNFCVILLTNRQTETGENITSLAEIMILCNNQNKMEIYRKCVSFWS